MKLQLCITYQHTCKTYYKFDYNVDQYKVFDKLKKNSPPDCEHDGLDKQEQEREKRLEYLHTSVR